MSFTEQDREHVAQLLADGGPEAACYALLRRAQRAEEEVEMLQRAREFLTGREPEPEIAGYHALLEVLQDIELRCVMHGLDYEEAVRWVRAEVRTALRGRRTKTTRRE